MAVRVNAETFATEVLQAEELVLEKDEGRGCLYGILFCQFCIKVDVDFYHFQSIWVSSCHF